MLRGSVMSALEACTSNRIMFELYSNEKLSPPQTVLIESHMRNPYLSPHAFFETIPYDVR